MFDLVVAANLLLTILHFGLAALTLAAAVHENYRRRVVASAAGLDLLEGRRRVTIPWDTIDVVEGNAGRWSDHLVVQTRSGDFHRLPQGLDATTVAQWRSRFAAASS